MDVKILAYDLGTGGIKASLFDIKGASLAGAFVSYDTVYGSGNVHEQAPDVWWEGVVTTTKMLLEKISAKPDDIVGLAISGQSLGVVPVDKDGNLLRKFTPIWSDTRSEKQTAEFFGEIDDDEWYKKTGNGFPPECYSVFKIMWYRDEEPEMFYRIYKVLGSKDYCNLRLTGKMMTDRSYASGSGVYDLLKDQYCMDYIKASGLPADIFPEVIKSHDVVGNLTPWAAEQLGLTTNTKVICGGVDNSCMALGAKGFKENRAYMSLGSSSWIAIIGNEPIIDIKYKPFVFSHVIDHMYTSATSIFAAGSSLRWLRDNICPDIYQDEQHGIIKDAYIKMDQMAETSPIGANSLIFNPSLAGGAMIEESKHICGGFVGLNLRHNRGDLIRSAIEGITYNLYYAMNVLSGYNNNITEMLLVGGGSKSPFWRQMFADVFGMPMIKTTIDQDCASLGAAALVAYGLEYWDNYERIDIVHELRVRHEPDLEKTEKYKEFYALSRYIAHFMAQTGQTIHNAAFSRKNSEL